MSIFKGIYFNKQATIETYEYGAHFKYEECIKKLEKLKKEKEEKEEPPLKSKEKPNFKALERIISRGSSIVSIEKQGESSKKTRLFIEKTKENKGKDSIELYKKVFEIVKKIDFEYLEVLANNNKDKSLYYQIRRLNEVIKEYKNEINNSTDKPYKSIIVSKNKTKSNSYANELYERNNDNNSLISSKTNTSHIFTRPKLNLNLKNIIKTEDFKGRTSGLYAKTNKTNTNESDRILKNDKNHIRNISLLTGKTSSRNRIEYSARVYKNNISLSKYKSNDDMNLNANPIKEQSYSMKRTGKMTRFINVDNHNDDKPVLPFNVYSRMSTYKK